MPGSNIVMKILTLALRIPIAIAIRKVIAKVWAAVRPDAEKRTPSEAGVKTTDALAWAALSGAGVAAAQLLTRKTAEGTFRVVTGNEPPPPPPSRAQKKAAKQEAKNQAKEDAQKADATKANPTKANPTKAKVEKAVGLRKGR